MNRRFAAPPFASLRFAPVPPLNVPRVAVVCRGYSPIGALRSQSLEDLSTPGQGQGDGARRRQVVEDHVGNGGRGRSERSERSSYRDWLLNAGPLSL